MTRPAHRISSRGFETQICGRPSIAHYSILIQWSSAYDLIKQIKILCLNLYKLLSTSPFAELKFLLNRSGIQEWSCILLTGGNQLSNNTLPRGVLVKYHRKLYYKLQMGVCGPDIIQLANVAIEFVMFG